MSLQQPSQIVDQQLPSLPQPPTFEIQQSPIAIVSTPSTPASAPPAMSVTPSSSSSTVFQSMAEFVAYLQAHPKSSTPLHTLTNVNYNVEARRAVVQVTVSKLIDTYGYTISTPIKQRVASWLAELTKLAATDYFDTKTHKGFLNKDLSNRRRNLPPIEKRWVWSKKACLSENSEPGTSGLASRRLMLSVPVANTDTDLLDLDGCPKHVTDCNNCRGMQILTYKLLFRPHQNAFKLMPCTYSSSVLRMF